jgi:hypothetical protein
MQRLSKQTGMAAANNGQEQRLHFANIIGIHAADFINGCRITVFCCSAWNETYANLYTGW